jgi:hypothetical protein
LRHDVDFEGNKEFRPGGGGEGEEGEEKLHGAWGDEVGTMIDGWRCGFRSL